MPRKGTARWKGFDYRSNMPVEWLRTEWKRFIEERTSRKTDDGSRLIFERHFDPRTRLDQLVLVAEVYDSD